MATRNWINGAAAAAVGATLIVGLGACSSGSSSSGSSASGSANGSSSAQIGVALITKTADNPFFVSMQQSAQAVSDLSRLAQELKTIINNMKD